MHRRLTRRSRRATLAAAIAVTAMAVLPGGPPAGASNGVPEPAYAGGVLFWPPSSSTTVAWRNGVKTTRNVGASAWAVAGHFSSSDGADALLYNPGSGVDSVVHASTLGTGGFSLSSKSISVNGNFRPLVGDFNADDIDDVLWYAAGSAPDSLWFFNASGGHSSVPLTINGTYRPTVLDAGGSGADDILWYGPGSAGDSIWRFDDAGNHVVVPITIGGNYTTVLGTFGDFYSGDRWPQVLFFNPGGPDSAWVFHDDGSHTSWNVPNIDGDYLPISGHFANTGRSTIIWYRPGTATERTWQFDKFGKVTQSNGPNVNGTYVPAVVDLDFNFYDDIVWSAAGTANLWKFGAGTFTYTNTTVTGLPADALPLPLIPRFTP